jgi:hypothetical protein
VFRVRMGTCARHLEAEVEKLRVNEEKVWLEARAATLKEWLRDGVVECRESRLAGWITQLFFKSHS